MYFLIDYDRGAGKLVSMTAFEADQGVAARAKRLALELEYHGAGRVREVVMLQAPTEAHIRKTHRRYFETLEELVKLAG